MKKTLQRYYETNDHSDLFDREFDVKSRANIVMEVPEKSGARNVSVEEVASGKLQSSLSYESAPTCDLEPSTQAFESSVGVTSPSRHPPRTSFPG